jgi:hypothetical protein
MAQGTKLKFFRTLSEHAKNTIIIPLISWPLFWYLGHYFGIFKLFFILETRVVIPATLHNISHSLSRVVIPATLHNISHSLSRVVIPATLHNISHSLSRVVIPATLHNISHSLSRVVIPGSVAGTTTLDRE